ncbi:MAG: hypothetical protein IPP15_06475 [Saprospiraceae bacterium]|uniref:Uncharacterized protein n=1 Tax=Candidatus Opimibacter skivensis TaxID=2982028 RepID=A0A9D7XSU2_9BACT|nr:hypothetical protein [Candidatus Opimibacter skivensis]
MRKKASERRRAEGKEQGAGSREQRAKSREQRAEILNFGIFTTPSSWFFVFRLLHIAFPQHLLRNGGIFAALELLIAFYSPIKAV